MHIVTNVHEHKRRPLHIHPQGRNAVTLSSQELRPVLLLDVPSDQLAVLGDSALAHCVALYRQRLEAGGVLVGAFNSNI